MKIAKKIIMISTQDDVDDLINRVEKKILFAYSFKFEDRRYFLRFLECLNVKYEHFTENTSTLIIVETYTYLKVSSDMFGLVLMD